MNITYYISMVRKCIKDCGVGWTVSRAVRELSGGQGLYTGYSDYLKEHTLTGDELAAEKEEKLSFKPLISVIIPLYESDTRLLGELLDAYMSQTYTRWELCMSDGSADKERLRSFVEKYVTQHDVTGYINGECIGKSECGSVIKYVAKDEGTLNISENTNQAIGVADGEFIALCDHDDMIYPETLYTIVKAINEHPDDTDFIYTDEDKLSEDGTTRFQPSVKPDFSPHYLESANYIVHMCVIRRSVAAAVGGFDSSVNGSQDYDYILRATELSRRVVHVPGIVYSWRVNATSAAGNENAKTYAYDAGLRAIRNHYKRMGVSAQIDQSENPGHYIASYELSGDPLISVVINSSENSKYSRRACAETIRSIRQNCGYKNLEFVRSLSRAKGNYIVLVSPGLKLAPQTGCKWIGHTVERERGVLAAAAAYLGVRREVKLVAGCVASDYRFRHGGYIPGVTDDRTLTMMRDSDFLRPLYQYRDFPALREGICMVRSEDKQLLRLMLKKGCVTQEDVDGIYGEDNLDDADSKGDAAMTGHDDKVPSDEMRDEDKTDRFMYYLRRPCLIYAAGLTCMGRR